MRFNTRFFRHLAAFVLLALTACNPVADNDQSEASVPSPTPSPDIVAAPSPLPAAPAESPTPALDSAWEDLPLLPPPPTPPKPIYVPESAQESSPLFPAVPPTGRVLEVTGAVWGAGFRNGLPGVVDGEVPEGEYAADRSFASVIHIRNPVELPAFLEPGQTLVIHLPEFPPDVYELRVYTTGDDPEAEKITDFPNRSLALERNLLIRWNDRRVWQRFHSPYADEIRVVLDPALLNADGNLITLENRGELTVPLDAIRLLPLRPGTRPAYVALEGAEWLPAKEAPWVRTTVVWVPPPLLPDEDLPKWDFPARIAPKDIEDVQSAWPRVEARYRELEAMDHPHLAILRDWVSPIRDAVVRGMVPIVQIRGDAHQVRDLRAAAFLFGDVAGGWRLRQTGDRYGVRAGLRDYIDTPLFLDGYSQETPDLPYPATISSGFWHLLLPNLGLQLRRYFNGDAPYERVEQVRDRAYTLNPDTSNHFNPDRQGPLGDYLFRNTAELLATTRRWVTLAWGIPCGPYFPDGSGRPSALWHHVRPLFRFGGISSRETLANIVPEQPGTLLNSAFWSVADNGSDRVEVLAGLPYAEGQHATLELPVPWSGPTRIRHHTVYPTWKSRDLPETESTVRVVDTSELPQSESSPFRGWVRHTFSVRRLHLFELTPSDAPPERIHRSTVSVDSPRIPETRTLFQVSETPPPAWWSRQRLGRTQRWNWKESGPVDLEAQVPTRPGRIQDWDPMKVYHLALSGEVDGVTPLSDTSTTLRFRDNPQQVPQIVRMEMEFNLLERSEAVGMWIRAHAPPGATPRPDGFRSRPHTRFWIGNHEGRQLIEIPYGTWCFLSGSASFWRTGRQTAVEVLRKGVLFWPDETLDSQPVLEVNSFDAYKLNLERGLDTPDKTLGFIHKREDGTLALLVVGIPGRGGFWRQRLDRFVDPTAFIHVEDETLRISAESPDDPPPEEVVFRIEGEPNAKLLEIHIPRMPPIPTEAYRKLILKDFPLIGHRLHDETLSAVLFNEIREPVGDKP